MAKLNIPKRKTKNPVIVAMVGLVGSGKTSVAKTIAPLLGATIITGDDIRLELHAKGERYDKARMIAEDVAMEAIKKGSNVVLDSDAIDAKKRASLQAKAKKNGTKVLYVRVYAERDVMIERLLSAKYSPESFFKSATIAIREMWRRTPNHYRWNSKNGGTFELKKLSFHIFATTDTTDSTKWPVEAHRTAEKIASQF